MELKQFKGTEILRTTETGVKINWEVSKWKIALAYIKYLYYKAIGRI